MRVGIKQAEEINLPFLVLKCCMIEQKVKLNNVYFFNVIVI